MEKTGRVVRLYLVTVPVNTAEDRLYHYDVLKSGKRRLQAEREGNKISAL